MVSFSCEECGDVLTKKKLDPHRNRCRGATFTCIDCMVHFPGTEYRVHTSCITEAEKYQGALYKNKKAKPSPNQAGQQTGQPESKAAMAHTAYVEDAPERFEDYLVHDDDDDDDDQSANENLPHAPTPPPPAVPEAPVNVFDYMVNPTPNGSSAHLPRGGPLLNKPSDEDTQQLVRFDQDANAYLDPVGYPAGGGDDVQLVRYADSKYETPAPKGERKKSSKDGDRKDKKRKRLHIDTHDRGERDQVMTDAPPVLHSGLTGGLSRLMRPAFPPSPDSGDNVAETPASPLKKTRHAKHAKSGGKTDKAADSIGNNLIAMLTNGQKPKRRKHSSSSSPSSKKKDHHHHRHPGGGEGADKEKRPPAPKLIEYRPSSSSKDDKDGGAGAGSDRAMIVYKPRADVLLAMINKGPDSERGCSMNKALKRYHRQRDASEDSLGRLMEEKELWRSLRMRKNDRGEIVLFSVA